jgi:hypothetical protein
MFARLLPTHHLALLPARWVLRPAGGGAANTFAADFAAGADVAAMLASLAGLLEKQAVSGRLRVTLSHQHVRLFLAPAPPAWLNPAEMRVWLDAALTDALGDAGEKADKAAKDGKGGGWQLAWDLTPPGQPIVVAAMANALRQGLADLCRLRGIKLVGAQPWLDAAWQRRRRQLGNASGWYALLEPERQVLLRLHNGRIVGLRQRQIVSDAAVELERLLARECLLANLPVGGDLWLERVGAVGDPGMQADWSRLGGRFSLHELAGPTDFAQAMLQ